jgi:transcriptional regulator with XRE-family HTH domain
LQLAYFEAMITPAQIRAARGLLGWSQEQLGQASGVSRQSIDNLEHERTDARPRTFDAVQAAFEKAGVEFTNGGEPGVKLKAKGKKKP